MSIIEKIIYMNNREDLIYLSFLDGPVDWWRGSKFSMQIQWA